MNIEEADLMEYCLGTLEADKVLDVERARDADPDVARALAEITATLAAVGETAPALAASPRLRERVVDSLAPGRRLDGFAARLARLFGMDLETARDTLTQAVKAPAAPWTRSPLPGTFLLPIRAGAASTRAHCSLLYLERGATVPRHRHRGSEHMLVLDGYAQENNSRLVGPGDEIVSDPGSTHEFNIIADTPCLIAMTLERGVELVRWRDRLVFARNAILNRLRRRP